MQNPSENAHLWRNQPSDPPDLRPLPSSSRRLKHAKIGQQCIVFGCKSNGMCNTPGLSFFQIPHVRTPAKFDAQLNDLWLRACADPDLEVPSIGRFKVQRFGRTQRICSKHFRPEDVRLGQRNRLKHGAIPVLHLPQKGSLAVPTVPRAPGSLKKCRQLFVKISDLEYASSMLQVNPEWPWRVLEKSDKDIVFYRARKHRFPRKSLFNATNDYVRFSNTMGVRMFTGKATVPPVGFAHLLTDGKAQNHAQVISLFEFDFTTFDHESH